MIKLILVDDHVLFRMGAKLALQGKSNIDIIGEAASGSELFKLLQTVDPDVLLLDIHLPDISGIEIAKQLRNSHPSLKILVLSGEDPEQLAECIINIGVAGYISKSSTLAEIEEAVVSVANGIEYYGRDIAHFLYLATKKQLKHAKQQELFTNRELEIIHYCAHGLQSKEIAEKLDISYHTVNFHKNNIFKKVGINNSVELVKFALKEKLV